MSEQQKVSVDLDIDLDDDADELEEMVEQEAPVNDDEQMTAMSVEEMIAHHHKQANNYTDKRISQIQERIKKQQLAIDDHTRRISAVEESINTHASEIEGIVTQQDQMMKLIESMQTTQASSDPQPQTQQTNPNAYQQAHHHVYGQPSKGVIDNTLGTVGGVAHGIIDTAAFLCESVIDLVTFGKAKRTDQSQAPHPQAQK